MTGYEGGETHPEAWKGIVDGYFQGAIYALQAEDRQTVTEDFVVGLLERGLVPDLGQLQAHLRESESIAQLIAYPFNPGYFEGSSVQCIDLSSKEPRPYFFAVAIGFPGTETTAQAQLQRMHISDEINEHALSHDTGVLVFPTPGAEEPTQE